MTDDNNPKVNHFAHALETITLRTLCDLLSPSNHHLRTDLAYAATNPSSNSEVDLFEIVHRKYYLYKPKKTLKNFTIEDVLLNRIEQALGNICYSILYNYYRNMVMIYSVSTETLLSLSSVENIISIIKSSPSVFHTWMTIAVGGNLTDWTKTIIQDKATEVVWHGANLSLLDRMIRESAKTSILSMEVFDGLSHFGATRQAFQTALEITQEITQKSQDPFSDLEICDYSLKVVITWYSVMTEQGISRPDGSILTLIANTDYGNLLVAAALMENMVRNGFSWSEANQLARERLVIIPWMSRGPAISISETVGISVYEYTLKQGLIRPNPIGGKTNPFKKISLNKCLRKYFGSRSPHQSVHKIIKHTLPNDITRLSPIISNTCTQLLANGEKLDAFGNPLLNKQLIKQINHRYSSKASNIRDLRPINNLLHACQYLNKR